MNSELAKAMLDSCYTAKRANNMLPSLPKGVTPSFIRFLDFIRVMEAENKTVKVSDVSDHFHLPRPGITKTLNNMEQSGYIKKIHSKEDARIIYVTPTEKGIALSDKYDREYFKKLVPVLEEISEEDAKTMVDTINKLYDIMLHSGNKHLKSQEE